MISIVVPVHNAESYIKNTIQTVARQTYQDWELVLVDDASTDHSTERIQEAIQMLPEEKQARVRLICLEQNGGAAKARNTGTTAAKGRYLAFLDADDLWYPEKLEKELHFMVEQDAAFVFTSYQFGDEQGKPTGKAVHAPAELTFHKALTRTVIFTSTVLIDREKVPEALQLMPETESEDTATWWRILKSGITARGLDEMLVIYRRPARTLSSNKGKAVKRIWGLYRQIAGLGRGQAALCLTGWAWRAAWRRVVPDQGQKRDNSSHFSSQIRQ